jgi:hypothetical protein
MMIVIYMDGGQKLTKIVMLFKEKIFHKNLEQLSMQQTGIHHNQ